MPDRSSLADLLLFVLALAAIFVQFGVVTYSTWRSMSNRNEGLSS